MPDIFLTSAFMLAATPDGADTGIPRQFSGVAYSGGKVTDWNYPVVVDLASTTVESGLPLLYAHNQTEDIGFVESAVNNGHNLAVSGQLFSDLDETARRVALKSKRGARYQMSVGVYNASESHIATGSVEVNGVLLEAPVTILKGGHIREVSVVPVGADRGSSAAFFSPPAPNEATPMPDPNSELEALRARAETAETNLAAMAARAEAAEAAVAAAAAEARKAEVLAAFKAANKTVSDADMAVYVGLSATQWDCVKTAVATKPALPGMLFSAVATGEPPQPGNEQIDFAAVNTQLLAQVSGRPTSKE